MSSLRQQREKQEFLAGCKPESPKTAPQETPSEIRRIGMTLRQKREIAQTDREFAAQEAQKKYEAEAPIRKMKEQLSKTHSELIAVERENARQDIFTKPSEEIARRTKQFSVVEDVTAGKIMTDLEVYQAISKSFAEFQKSLKKVGVVLTKDGIQKLYKICVNNPSADTRDPKAFQQIFDYGYELGLWTEGDAIGLENLNPVAEQAPVTERTAEIVQAELDAIHDARTPEDRLKVQKLRIELLTMEASAGIWSEFVQFIRKNYDEFSYDEQKRCTTWLGENNLLMNAVNLNKYRVARGWLTDDERLAEQISNDPRSASDYSFKTDVRNNQRELSHQK